MLSRIDGLALVGSVLLMGITPGESAAPKPNAAPRSVHLTRCVLEPVELGRLPCDSAILVESETGRVLFEQNADEPRSPASLSKIALQLVVMRDLQEGHVRLDELIETSANASTMGGSQVFLKHGEKQTLRALLEAIVIASANDAAMAVAEHIAGSEEAFVARMNSLARRLGCKGTEFANVHGLDLRRRPKNFSTARDMAILSRALLEYPLALELAGIWRTPFRNGEFWLNSTNLMLKSYAGLDGLKTGYTRRAGGCFSGTAERDGVRFVAVVMGARPGKDRFHVAKRMLDAAYRAEPRWAELIHAGERLTPTVASAAEATRTQTVAWTAGSVRVLVEKARRGELSVRFRSHRPATTRIDTGETLGFVDCRLGDHTFASIPARAGEDLEWAPEVTALGPPN